MSKPFFLSSRATISHRPPFEQIVIIFLSLGSSPFAASRKTLPIGTFREPGTFLSDDLNSSASRTSNNRTSFLSSKNFFRSDGLTI